MMLTDKYGQVRERYEYDAFGNLYEGAFARVNAVGYTGKRYDTKSGRYDYGFREYSPSVGRFTTLDPIRAGSNWYTYCRNEPINYVDILGLTASDKKESSTNKDSRTVINGAERQITGAGYYSGGNNGGSGSTWVVPGETRIESLSDRIQRAVDGNLGQPYVYPSSSDKTNTKYPDYTIENGYKQNDCDTWAENRLHEANAPVPALFQDAINLSVQEKIQLGLELGILSTSPDTGWNVILMTDSRREGEEGHEALVKKSEDAKSMTLYEQGHHHWESSSQENYDPSTDVTTSQLYNTFYYYHVGE
jgi:RHS repeat-associated protein